MKARIIIAFFFCCSFAAAVKAQDFHLAQYDAFSLYMNPALTGNYLGEDGDYRANLVYRNQWRSLSPKPFATYGVSYDMPYKRYGFGGYILDNKSGVGNFNTLNFQLSGAYFITDPKTSPHLLSTGLQLGLFYKSYNPSKLLFESQYDYSSGTLNPDIASGENQNRVNRANFDANMGIFYKYRDTQKKYWPFIGLSLFHVNRPNESFLDSKSKLPIRWNIQTGCDYQVNEKLKLVPMVLYMNQARAWELNMGLLSYYRLNDSKDVKYDLVAGLNYRLKDAVIMQLGVKKDNVVLRMSYDFNTSKLNAYSGGKGGFEITLQVIGIKGQPVFKTMAKF